MADRRTHVIRLTAEGDTSVYLDIERIDLLVTTASGPDHWQKTYTLLDWGDGATAQAYGPGDIQTEIATTPTTVVAGPGPTGTNREVMIVEVANPANPSQIVKVGAVTQMTAIEYGESWQKTISLLDDKDDNVSRTTTVVRVSGSVNKTNYVDQEVVDAYRSIEYGGKHWQKTVLALDNKYLIDTFGPPPMGSTPMPVRLDPFQNIVNVSWTNDFLIVSYIIDAFRNPHDIVTIKLKNFNIPGWAGVEVPINILTSWTAYPSRLPSSMLGDDTPSNNPLGAMAWASPVNISGHDLGAGDAAWGHPEPDSGNVTTEGWYQGYFVLNLGAAGNTGALTFDIENPFVGESSPPGVTAPNWVPQTIATALAYSTFGGPPAGVPGWPLYWFGPVDIGGEQGFIYSNTQGTGGLSAKTNLTDFFAVDPDVAKGLWKNPVGNTNWPPLLSLTPAIWMGSGPLHGLMAFAIQQQSTENISPGFYLPQIYLTTARNVKSVSTPGNTLGTAIYAPPTTADQTPTITRFVGNGGDYVHGGFVNDPPSAGRLVILDGPTIADWASNTTPKSLVAGWFEGAELHLGNFESVLTAYLKVSNSLFNYFSGDAGTVTVNLETLEITATGDN